MKPIANAINFFNVPERTISDSPKMEGEEDLSLGDFTTFKRTAVAHRRSSSSYNKRKFKPNTKDDGQMSELCKTIMAEFSDAALSSRSNSAESLEKSIRWKNRIYRKTQKTIEILAQKQMLESSDPFESQIMRKQQALLMNTQVSEDQAFLQPSTAFDEEEVLILEARDKDSKTQRLTEKKKETKAKPTKARRKRSTDNRLVHHNPGNDKPRTKIGRRAFKLSNDAGFPLHPLNICESKNEQGLDLPLDAAELSPVNNQLDLLSVFGLNDMADNSDDTTDADTSTKSSCTSPCDR